MYVINAMFDGWRPTHRSGPVDNAMSNCPFTLRQLLQQVYKVALHQLMLRSVDPFRYRLQFRLNRFKDNPCFPLKSFITWAGPNRSSIWTAAFGAVSCWHATGSSSRTPRTAATCVPTLRSIGVCGSCISCSSNGYDEGSCTACGACESCTCTAFSSKHGAPTGVPLARINEEVLSVGLNALINRKEARHGNAAHLPCNI